jgi:cysteine synthase A
VNQLNSADTSVGYFPLGEEIWSQRNGEIDAFVHSVGTAASLNGVTTVLKRHDPQIKNRRRRAQRIRCIGGRSSRRSRH